MIRLSHLNDAMPSGFINQIKSRLRSRIQTEPYDGRAGGAAVAAAAAARGSGGFGVGTPRHPPRRRASLTVRHGRRLHVARCPIWQPHMRTSIPWTETFIATPEPIGRHECPELHTIGGFRPVSSVHRTSARARVLVRVNSCSLCHHKPFAADHDVDQWLRSSSGCPHAIDCSISELRYKASRKQRRRCQLCRLTCCAIPHAYRT